MLSFSNSHIRLARAVWILARRAGLVRGLVVHVTRPAPTSPSTRRRIGLNIPLHEARALAEEYELPPIITLDEAAKVARRSKYTIKRLVSEGRFPKSAKPGKPLLFLRDRYIQELMKEHG